MCALWVCVEVFPCHVCSYVSVCMGCRVCARLQRQLSFQEKEMVPISFRVLKKLRCLLGSRSQGKVSSSGKFKPHFFCIQDSRVSVGMDENRIYFSLLSLLGHDVVWDRGNKVKEDCLHHTLLWERRFPHVSPCCKMSTYLSIVWERNFAFPNFWGLKVYALLFTVIANCIGVFNPLYCPQKPEGEIAIIWILSLSAFDTVVAIM